jgi:2-hydroxychromene-2-carboxylate isomerase
MTPLRFWFDPISPYAYLAFERLPQVLQGCSYAVEYRPVLFAGLLKHWGQLGPAEIAPKRDWTWRQVRWLAARDGVPLVLPPRHPFNPLALLRLLLATADEGAWPNRWACEAVLHAVWRSGRAADDPENVQALRDQLDAAMRQGGQGGLRRDPQGDAVRRQLRAAGEEALARGVFGVPTVEIVPSGRCFWGQEALPMLRDGLTGDAGFDAGWDLPGPPDGVTRPR